MIINVAGTSGAGKSHLMRNILAALGGSMHGPVLLEERDRIIGYLFHATKPQQRDVFVIGAYNAPTGGCDTIKEISKVFDLILQHHNSGHHVLYEGLFVMNMTRGPQLAQEVGKDLCILKLTTPLSACIASINKRRAERGEGPLEDRTNTKGNYRRAENYCAKMRDAGARVFKVTRVEAPAQLMKLLGM